MDRSTTGNSERIAEKSHSAMEVAASLLII